MEEYLRYCRSLDFEQRPDYNFLRGLFRKVLVERSVSNDIEYDWIKRKRREREERAARSKAKKQVSLVA